MLIMTIGLTPLPGIEIQARNREIIDRMGLAIRKLHDNIKKNTAFKERMY